MSKKRKTKKEKMRSALRLTNAQTDTPSSSPIYSIRTSTQLPQPTLHAVTVSHVDYRYVTQDMKKTFFITSILLGASLILASLLQNNIIQLSMFGY